jgi:hypothetical protein
MNQDKIIAALTDMRQLSKSLTSEEFDFALRLLHAETYSGTSMGESKGVKSDSKKKPGRSAGGGKKKPGRPAGSGKKKPGRPAGSTNRAGKKNREEDNNEPVTSYGLSDFQEAHGIPETTLSAIFKVEEGVASPLYESLGSSKKSKSQMNAILLAGLAGAMTNGKFIADREFVRAECIRFNMMDNNFSINLNRHKHLFKKITRKEIILGSEGLDLLAEMIKGA